MGNTWARVPVFAQSTVPAPARRGKHGSIQNVTEQGLIVLAAVVGFVMYLQLVMNSGDTVALLKRIEKQLKERDQA